MEYTRKSPPGMTKLFKYLMLSMFSLVFFCTCDKDDEVSGEKFQVTM